jgi:putative amide transporter protein
MTHLALFFVGSVYLINGLALLGLIEPKSSAPLNVLIGSLLLAVTGYLVLPLSNLAARESLDTVVGSVGYLLFAFTFLYVGIINYTGHPDSGLGWYCGWSAIVSACLSAVQLLHYADVKSSALWAVWTVVFIAFFALIILKAERFGRATGWFVIAAGFTTCFVPGGLLILGKWNSLSDNVVLTMEVGTVVLFGLLLLRSAGTARGFVEQHQRPA